MDKIPPEKDNVIDSASAPKDDVRPPQSLLDKIKSFHLPDSRLQIVIPVLIVLMVLLVGGGGTYFIASQVLAPQASQTTSSSNDISSIKLPTPTQAPVTPKATPTAMNTPVGSLTPTLSPTASAAANWTNYSFGPLSLNFMYPPGWFVNLAATSGAPYLYVQNFAGNFPTNPVGNYAIFIGRLEQVGITTVTALQTQLALNDVSPTYVNGVNLGTPIVSSSSATTINGYAAFKRNISYSSSPSATFQEVYVLDGISNVVRFAPLLDIQGATPFLNTLLSTIAFTN